MHTDLINTPARSVSRLATDRPRSKAMQASPGYNEAARFAGTAVVIKMGTVILQKLMHPQRFFLLGLLQATVFSGDSFGEAPDRLRFATFNASLNRRDAGALLSDLASPDNAQARKVAEIIQRVRPDVLLLNEFDFDEEGLAA